MPQNISSEVAAAAINNAADQGYANIFSGWMYAQNCAETVLQWRIIAEPVIDGQVEVYTYVAGQWVLEVFPFEGGAGLCSIAGPAALQYLQETVPITEYRLLRVTGSYMGEQFGSPGNPDDDAVFPATWEPGMTAYLTPTTDLVGSILESSIVWGLDLTSDCQSGANPTWPTPTT